MGINLYLINLLQKSLFFKVLLITLLLCFLSFFLFGIYHILEVKSIYKELSKEQINKTTKETIAQYLANLEKESVLIEKDFEKVEQNLLLLQKQAEDVFSEKRALDHLPNLNLVKHPLGFYWEPIAHQDKTANTFVSARINIENSFIYKDLQKTKVLEPLLKQTIINEPNLKAVYFILSESAWIVYPSVDVPYEVMLNKLPPDINVHEYEFYYRANLSYNPEKMLQWTQKYVDVTQWGWVITALVPVYLSDGTFRGVIGADFPINKITTRIEGLSFAEPNAYAFILDQAGNLVAGNKEQFNKQFNSSISKLISKMERSSTVNNQKFTDNFGKQNYILSTTIPNTKWTLNFSIPVDDIVKPMKQKANSLLSLKIKQSFQRLFIFLIIASILLTFLSYSLSRKITKPIKQLTTTIKQSATGSYGRQILVQSNDEIGQLTVTFNEMSLIIRDLIKELKLRADILEEKVLERTRELAHSNTKLLQTYGCLKQSEQARTELIVHISHDLKTPLTKIKGFLQVIKSFDLPISKQKDYIELILLQTNHMIELINDLSELSSLHVNDISFEKEWYPIDFLINHATEIVRNKGIDRLITIKTKYEEDLPLVYIDPKQMNRALTNILTNSIKYAKPNGEIRIDCQVFTKTEQCILIFQDNGIGIHHKNLKRIFEPYYREKRTNNETFGRGIGLSIVKKIIKGHNGTINMQSKVNEGTTVIISLPTDKPTQN